MIIRIFQLAIIIISFCRLTDASLSKYWPFFSGLNVSYSHIHGFYDLSSDHQYSPDISDIYHPGIEFGKRFRLFHSFFISPSVHYTYGFSKRRLPYTLSLNDGTDIYCNLYKTYSVIGVVSQLQFTLPFKIEKPTIFTAAGGGIHYTTHKELYR
jgi:hypothetical protein